MVGTIADLEDRSTAKGLRGADPTPLLQRSEPSLVNAAPAALRQRIAFTTITDPNDVKSWSGTVFHMAQALGGAGFGVAPVGPLHAPYLKVAKAVSRLRRRAGLSHSSPSHTPIVTRQYGRDAVRKIREAAPDVVLALAGSPFAWNCPPEFPLVYISDATFRRIAGFYARYTNLSRAGWAWADKLERDTIGRADLLLYPSEWAAESAIADYGADPARVHVIPFGANLDDPCPPVPVSLHRGARCNLLFVGVDWDRKGGPVAVDAVMALRRRGIDAHLTICGCTPPEPLDASAVTVIPFLDKHDPVAREQLEALYRAAHFFVLPTRAECYGIVFCEASAYGVPSLAPSAGGVPGVVNDGVNGFLLPSDAPGEAYAGMMAAFVEDGARYAALRQATRRDYEQRLNWTVWAARTGALIRAL